MKKIFNRKSLNIAAVGVLAVVGVGVVASAAGATTTGSPTAVANQAISWTKKLNSDIYGNPTITGMHLPGVGGNVPQAVKAINGKANSAQSTANQAEKDAQNAAKGNGPAPTYTVTQAPLTTSQVDMDQQGYTASFDTSHLSGTESVTVTGFATPGYYKSEPDKGKPGTFDKVFFPYADKPITPYGDTVILAHNGVGSGQSSNKNVTVSNGIVTIDVPAPKGTVSATYSGSAGLLTTGN